MNEAAERPDPDELLRRVQAGEARQKRGKLKIFFGFAPGVGKTYRMLQVARDLAQHQQDVVIGVVETHARHDTTALVEGLPLLPRKQLEYRGRKLEELDLDAALARKPRVILVDELAHSNAPGSRHPKRWQDVEELLDAGVDVLSTMNVQHVESLNDVVAQITHVSVRETVPDALLDKADAIELVDIAPEELLQRLKEGKVYLAEQAERATEHFFRRGNLLALRELALRRTAQHVDDDVREYRREHNVSTTWPAGEQIMVCVGPSPTSARLIRAAARMAAGLRCRWVAAYVDPASVRGVSPREQEQLEAHLRVAESLGAAVTRLSGGRIAAALLDYARKHNVTRIVIGKPTHSRLRDRLRGSLLDDVVRGSGDIDVHVISGDETVSTARDPAPRKLGSSPRAYAGAAVLTAGTLGLAVALRALLRLPDLEMLFLLTVMISAMWLGRGPALLAAALSVAAYDFFFVPPFHTFTVSDRTYVLTFAMMFGVGLAISTLAARLRRQEREASSREERTAVLYALTKELAATNSPARIAEIAARHAAMVFEARALVLVPNGSGALQIAGRSSSDLALEPKELGVAKWAFEHDQPAGLGTDTLPGSETLCTPLRMGQAQLGVLALLLARAEPPSSEQRAFLELFCRQVAVALETTRLAEEARLSALKAKTEELRASLLSAVSHDLRTPLASITGAATALRDDPKLSGDTRLELTESIVDEAERLERLVGNLLDMTRLEAGGLSLKTDWVPLDELVSSALTRLEKRLGDRPVRVTIAPELPLVRVDPVLLEQVFINLLENAIKHTPESAPIAIQAQLEGSAIGVTVSDRGPGLPRGAEEKVFEKFYRGPEPRASGVGLGLAICRGIAEAHGGALRAYNDPMGGAVFHLTLPIGGQPPAMPELEPSER